MFSLISIGQTGNYVCAKKNNPSRLPNYGIAHLKSVSFLAFDAFLALSMIGLAIAGHTNALHFSSIANQSLLYAGVGILGSNGFMMAIKSSIFKRRAEKRSSNPIESNKLDKAGSGQKRSVKPIVIALVTLAALGLVLTGVVGGQTHLLHLSRLATDSLTYSGLALLGVASISQAIREQHKKSKIKKDRDIAFFWNKAGLLG